MTDDKYLQPFSNGRLSLQVSNKGRRTASNLATDSELACSEGLSNPSNSQINMCAAQAATNHTRQLLSRARNYDQRDDES
ncbi:hypothetical protein BDZ89DRAFT_1140449 [Hymenopellis radicata]|nr:hypothetical protein BDZ89DRAFT_1140449 [Hymenopellis radicata]